MKRALSEFTQAEEVKRFTVGSVEHIPGGGMKRPLSAQIDRKQKNFVAVEIGGNESTALGLKENTAHEILKRSHEPKGK